VVLHNFVVEHTEIECKAEFDGVARGQSDLVGLGVGFESVLLDLLHKGTFGILSNIAVVVSDHLDEESF